MPAGTPLDEIIVRDVRNVWQMRGWRVGQPPAFGEFHGRAGSFGRAAREAAQLRNLLRSPAIPEVITTAQRVRTAPSTIRGASGLGWGTAALAVIFSLGYLEVSRMRQQREEDERAKKEAEERRLLRLAREKELPEVTVTARPIHIPVVASLPTFIDIPLPDPFRMRPPAPEPSAPLEMPVPSPEIEIAPIAPPQIPAPAPVPSPVPLPIPAPLPAPLPRALPLSRPGTAPARRIRPGTAPLTQPAPRPVTRLAPAPRGAPRHWPPGISPLTGPLGEVLPLPLPQPAPDPARERCKPCEEDKPRTECWRKLVKEHMWPDQDEDYKWARIDCLTGREL